MSSKGTLVSIHVYPVKGMRSCDVDSSFVEPRGLRGDRRLVVIDSEGMFLSQRATPSLATFVPRLIENRLEIFDRNGESIAFDLRTGARRRVRVWKDEVDACDQGDEVSTWLSERLETEARLVLMDAKAVRPVNPLFGRDGDEVSFADGFPLLSTAVESLGDLNRRMEIPLPMNRFRPNLVFGGFAPWQEDDWSHIRVGECEFLVVKPCARCLVTTTDQVTGERMGQEPLRTLATFRQVDGQAMFGQNLIPLSIGLIRVGDPVEALA